MWSLVALSLAAGAFGALAGGCDQKVDEGGDKYTEGRQSVEVRYKESSQKVLFSDLETSFPVDDETPCVLVDDLVLASGLVDDVSKVYLDFVGADGFSPIGVCPEAMAPTPGKYAHQGYIERGTTRLLWNEATHFEKCMFVRDVVRIDLADSADDLPMAADGEQPKDTDNTPSLEGEPFEKVEVHYDGKTTTVQTAVLETVEMYGEQAIRVSALLKAAGVSAALDAVTIDFEGSDGYRPSAQGKCLKFLPAAGELADKAAVNIKTSELIWEKSLGVSPCAWVKLVAHIYVEPKKAP